MHSCAPTAALVISGTTASSAKTGITEIQRYWVRDVCLARAMAIRVKNPPASATSARETPKAGGAKDAKKDSSVTPKWVVKCASAPISARSIICAIRVMESVHASQIIVANYVINVPLDMQMFQCSAHPASATKADRSTILVIP
jgi:hypothetical protein